jgi:cyclomaltodextrinase / maltogenic alpha-amylase / neopullulanase
MDGWMDGLGAHVDGWRLDVAGEIDPSYVVDPSNGYWKGFREAVRGVKEDAFICGELWKKVPQYLLGDEWYV